MAQGPAIPENLLCYMDGQVELLDNLIPIVFTRFRKTDIHRARITTRRLKAAMDVLKPRLSPAPRRTLNRVLRKVRQRLGPLRDLDVMIQHVDEFRDRRRYGAAIDWLTVKLKQERQRLQRRCSKRRAGEVGFGPWQKVRTHSLALGNEVGGLLARSITAQLDSFVQYADHFSCPAKAASIPSRDPHALRIAGKRLRYTVEMTVAAECPSPNDSLKRFKQLQDSLGLWHDYTVLIQAAMQAALDHQLAIHDPVCHRQLLGLLSAASAQAQRHLLAFGSRWAKHKRVLVREVQALAAQCGSSAIRTAKRQ